MSAERDALILVVDDIAQNIALVQAQLERAGYRVLAALSGQQAIDMALDSHPDVIILDIMMPGLDGYEVCRRLRENDSTRAVPIIMLTSLQEKADKLRALEMGADDFLSKPVDRAELLARVRSSLRMKGIFDDLARSKMQLEEQASKLTAEKSRIEAILASMNDGVLMTDVDGRITFLNSAVETIAGVTLDECLGRVWYQALSVRSGNGQPLDAASCPVLAAMRGNAGVIQQELVIWRDDGREVIISVAASPVAGTQEDAEGGVVVFRDVTSQREIQRMKEDFVGLVSHELRTPLSAIYGFAELLLERERLSDTAKTYVETMFKEADRMTSLVNDFLDIERLASGRMSFHFRSLSPGEIVAEAREHLASQLARHPVVVDVPPGPLFVRADRDRLVQVLLNLMSNAIKYSPEGGEIKVRVEPVGRQVRISVADQGLGLPTSSIPRLFEKFYRVEESAHRRVSGTGLGLTICKQMVEGMGGRIWAESPGTGKGSTFHFTLPSAGAPMVISEAPLGSHGRILLAKDDPTLAALILERLGPVGFTVEAVSSGEEAINHVRAEKPAAVVLDIALPGEPDGWGVLAALREDPATAEIPVILISGQDNQHALALGADEFLVKPVPSQRLVTSMRRLAGPPSARPIIVADHSRVSREVAKEILGNDGFTVITVSDGEAALEALRERPPAALILDLIMPKLDGFGVLDALRSDPALADLPVLMLTAKDLSNEERQHLQQRMSEVLRQPGGSATNIVAALLRSIKPRATPKTGLAVSAVDNQRETLRSA